MLNVPDPNGYWSEDEGRRAVEAWRRSGETATTFARRHGLQAKRLKYWSERLAQTEPSQALSFVPAAVVTFGEVAAVIRVPSGVAIELASATPTQIAAIANALARPAP